VPQDFRDATVVPVYKRKDDKAQCGNYHGISLLSTAGKILARVLLNRLAQDIACKMVSETQCGFRGGRGKKRYDICSLTSPREMLGTAQEPVCRVSRPDQSI